MDKSLLKLSKKLIDLAEQIISIGRIFAPVEEKYRQTFLKRVNEIERSWRRKHKSLLPGETRYGEERIGYCREDEFGGIEECFVVEFDGHNWIVKHYPSQRIYGQFNSKLEALKSMKETITDYSYELAEREV